MVLRDTLTREAEPIKGKMQRLMNTSKKARSQVFYASLAIYSSRNMVEEISEGLQIQPSTTGERAGVFSWIYSTRNSRNCKNVEQHLQLLRRKFADSTQQLVRFTGEGCEITVWVFFGVGKEINSCIALDVELLAWLSSFGADVCIDVWN